MENPLAKKVKIADMKLNMVDCPKGLEKRYKKHMKILLGEEE